MFVLTCNGFKRCWCGRDKLQGYGPAEKRDWHTLGEKMPDKTLVYFQILNIFERNAALTFHAIYRNEFKFCFSVIFISKS